MSAFKHQAFALDPRQRHAKFCQEWIKIFVIVFVPGASFLRSLFYWAKNFPRGLYAFVNLNLYDKTLQLIC